MTQKFWKDAVSNDTLKVVELELGIDLPKAYAAQIKKQNGGALNKSRIKSEPNRLSETHVTVGRFLSLTGAISVQRSNYLVNAYGYPKGSIVFAFGTVDNKTAFYFKYSSKADKDPEVWYFDFGTSFKLADNFKQFMSNLIL